MAKEHTEVCPLCGQKIGEKLLSRDDFAQIITPYEKEQEEAKQKHQESLDKLNKINDKVSTINAKIDEKVSFINTLLPEVEKLRENVAERLKRFESFLPHHICRVTQSGDCTGLENRGYESMGIDTSARRHLWAVSSVGRALG